MSGNVLMHAKSKYNAYCPIDRRTLVFNLAIPLGPFGPGLFGNPFVVDVKWEWPEDAVAKHTVESLDAIVEGVKSGLELVFAGAERMAWQRDYESIIAAARKTAVAIIDDAKREKEEE